MGGGRALERGCQNKVCDDMLASELFLFLNCTKEHAATGVRGSTLPHILNEMEVMRFNLHHR